ncbi:MAG: hypothetical protein P1Q69_02270 [Candidatus Thorarchaeota archaeon]|nr:hypothetical protein [Candidatus Thorarchaeota archaeon]
MKPVSFITSIFFIVIIMFASSSVATFEINDPSIVSITTVSSYEVHSPITITHNSDFNVTYGFPGNGTKESPYLIEGLNISSDTKCISISFTDCYFEIVDCILIEEQTSDSSTPSE